MLVQIEPLEKACLQYLVNKLQYMTFGEAFDVALLADHLGLSTLLEEAATELVQWLWCDEHLDIMCKLGVLLQMAPYKQDAGKRSNLLHHPKRGAFTELQVLELLDRMGCHEDEILSTLQMEGLQPDELNALLAAIVSRPKESSQLLRAAVQQHLVPVALRPHPLWNQSVRIVGNISFHQDQTFAIEPSGLLLHIRHSFREGTTSSACAGRPRLTCQWSGNDR